MACRRGPRLRGKSDRRPGAARRDRQRRGRELQRVFEACDRDRTAALRSGGRRAAGARDSDRSEDEPPISLLAHLRARRSSRADLRVPSGRALRSEERSALRSEKGPARPLWPGRRRPGRLQPRRRERRRRQHPGGHEKRRRGPVHVRLGRRPALEPPVVPDGGVRNACPWVHHAPHLGRIGDYAGHVRRPDREDSGTCNSWV